MPDYDNLLKTTLPDSLEGAIRGIDRIFDIPKQLLQADVSHFEHLSCSVFAYFDRNDVFYVNQCGRKLLSMRRPSFEKDRDTSPPIFWLEDDSPLIAADEFVTRRQTPVHETRELITLSWGKTWLHGTKYPIRSVNGQTIALLFAGYEVPPSKQIELVANHYRNSQTGTGNN